MRTVLISVLLTGASALTLGAQDEAAYQTYMKTVVANFGLVRNAADNAAAKAPATIMADNFDKMASFWNARNAPDAVKFAENARDAARAIANGSGDKTENIAKIQAQCGGCHKAHREGAAPDFKIK
jgi:hypothetical protein